MKNLVMAILSLVLQSAEYQAFTVVDSKCRFNQLHSRACLESSRKGDNEEQQGGDSDNEWANAFCSTEMRELQNRLVGMRAKMLEEELQKPPNPRLSPQGFVRQLLKELWYNSEPLPDSGFRVLLRSSTTEWRNQLFQSVGAKLDQATEEMVASALGEAMGRPNNQFAILVGEAEDYVPTFPSDPLDYADGTCWLECRLRGRNDNALLVVTGWSLKQNPLDGAWLVDAIDWQDFRDEFRPGIGREEWMRICG